MSRTADAKQASTYTCQDCPGDVVATSRPGGCPDCGGRLHNATLDRGGRGRPRIVFTYECVERGHRLVAGQRPRSCPACESPVRNVTLAGQ